MEDSSCYNCFNFVATIPLIKGITIFDTRLDYKSAIGKCKHGLLTKGNSCELRTFKNVLTVGNRKMKAYESATRCGFFEGE